MSSFNAEKLRVHSFALQWQQGKFSVQRALGCLAVLIAGLSLASVYLYADNGSLAKIEVISNDDRRQYIGHDVQGDALSVAAVETDEAMRSVILGSGYAGKRMVVVGVRGHILYSDDQGKSWDQASVPVRTTLTSVFFISPTKGWAVGHETVILTTDDGGVSWTKVLDGYQANPVVLEAAQQRIGDLKAEMANLSKLEKRAYREQQDFAEMALDEAKRDVGLGPNKALMDVWFTNESVGFVIGASGYMLRTIDGGKTWHDWSGSLASTDFYHFYKIFGTDHGGLFLLGEAGQAYRSNDQGNNWQRLNVPYQGSFFGGLAKASDHSVYIFGMSGVVLKSMDNGDSWRQLVTNTRSILQNASVIENDRVAIVGLGGVLLIEDPQRNAFAVKSLGSRAAFTGVLAGENQQFVAVGERGIRLYDESVAQDNDRIKSVDSLRFMFSKRD